MDTELYDLASIVGRFLLRGRLTLVTAESCTGGGVGQALTMVPGSSQWFEGGFLTYSNQSKVDFLGVKKATIETHGAVSEEVVSEMALGALQKSKADLSIAVSGIAGPEGGSPGKPVGTVWIAIGRSNGYLKVENLCFSGDRESIRRQSVSVLLGRLAKILK